MNDRIKELAEQAGWGKGHTYDDCMQCSPFDPEKFAELIVQECASLAKSRSEYIQSMETDDRGDQMQIQSLAWQFEEFGYKIKKHFGVKQ